LQLIIRQHLELLAIKKLMINILLEQGLFRHADQVALTPDYIPGSVTPGINGNFYHITPDPLKVGSVTRSEFGIHFDANSSVAPGSAGCIVFEDSTQWSNFQKWMSDYKTTYSPGSTIINLVVEYV
jgi:hypothetical protein